MTSPRTRSYKTGTSRKRATLQIAVPDLMTAPGSSTRTVSDASWANDLGLAELVDMISTDRRYAPYIRRVLLSVPDDPAVISWRQSILRDFTDCPELAPRIEAVLPRLSDLGRGFAQLGKHQRGLLLETVDRLADLDLYLALIQDLNAAFQGLALTSVGLCALRDGLATALQSEAFQTLAAELPELRAPLSNLHSLTVGINLDSELHPVSTVLLGINDHKFSEATSLLDRLIGVRTDPSHETGIAPLHRVPTDIEARPLSPLFQDLDKLTQQMALPVARALARYVKESSVALSRLEEQLAFYAAGARLHAKLTKRGISICFPRLAPAEDRVTHIEGLLNINLALRQPDALVASDVHFDSEGRIGLVTGPNSGGKSTYLQAVGLAYVLAQAGLFIPANSALISPVDGIWTHFPALETRQQGRLSEEAARLRQIFVSVTAHSLVLMNESLSSTTPGEALYLAQDVLCGLRAIGVRGLYATHLVELVAHIPHIEDAVEGDSRLLSLVAGIQPSATDGRDQPTFKISPGAPLASAYAREIAHKHGISLDQILAARKAQGQAANGSA